MSVEAQSMQNGFLSSRFSQGSRFLVKELVKEKDHEVNEAPGMPVYPGSFLTKKEFIIIILSQSLIIVI